MKNARFLLHLLLITALSAALYPFPLLLAIWSGSAGWTAPVMTAALVLCVWLGTLYILLLRRQYARHPRWVNGGVWALTLLLCVLGSLFAPYPTRLAQVLLGITAGGCFFGGARLVFHPLEHLVHPNVFVGLCLWDCFSGFLIYLTGVKLPFLPMVLLFAANAALFALVHNRDAMERMLSGERRRHLGTAHGDSPQQRQAHGDSLWCRTCAGFVQPSSGEGNALAVALDLYRILLRTALAAVAGQQFRHSGGDTGKRQG